MNEAAKISKLPTGVPGLDIITHGGIPEGRSVLVTGRSGTGKTILALQIAANLSRQGVKTILLAVEESPEDLILTGDGLGMDLSGAIKEGALRVSDASRPVEGPMVVSGEYDISGLIHRVRAIVKQTGARAVVLDSATALFSPRPPTMAHRSARLRWARRSSGDTVTSKRVPEIAARRSRKNRASYPWRGSFSSSDSTWRASTPRSTNAATAMSPAMPAEQSR